MKVKRHSPEQIVRKLQEADAMLTVGKTVGQVCQALEVSEPTLQRWRNQYGGMKAQEAKRLRELEDENRRLKKLLAEAGYPTGLELNFANTALPGTQFMVDVGTAVVDMWTKIGVRVKLTNYEWGSFAPLALGNQARLAGNASMYRTVGRPDVPWRYNGSFASDSDQHLIGDKNTCDARRWSRTCWRSAIRRSAPR